MTIGFFNNIYTNKEYSPIIHSNWGGGELNFNLDSKLNYNNGVVWDYTGDSSDLEKLIILDEIYTRNNCEYNLVIPYMPYSRQDRPESYHGPNSLYALSKILNTLNYTTIDTWDIHNDSTANYFRKLYNVPKLEISGFTDMIEKYHYLISPDAGAYKEVSKIGELCDKDVLCANKFRKEGAPVLDFKYSGLEGKAIIVDDICDGGRTFIELAKISKLANPNLKLDLYVTHGIFSRGTEELRKYFDNIFSTNRKLSTPIITEVNK